MAKDEEVEWRRIRYYYKLGYYLDKLNRNRLGT